MRTLLHYLALFLRKLFGGEIVVLFSRYWKVAVFCFCLILLYMTFHFRVIDTSKEIRANNRELKELKIRHTTLQSILQDKCTRDEVERNLAILGSSLHAPLNPPTIVKNN